MANLKLLIDTDIIIDCLKGIRAARELFRTQNIEVYCSVLSKKELFSKPHEEFIKPLLKTALKYNIDLTIISESPITWEDSLKMRDVLKKLK